MDSKRTGTTIPYLSASKAHRAFGQDVAVTLRAADRLRERRLRVLEDASVGS
jgi:hypothetical protein